MYSHRNYMDNLSDEQIKILIISKESPHISEIINDNNDSYYIQDHFIRSTSKFDKFSSFFDEFNFSTTDEIESLQKTKEIIKSELGVSGVDVLLSHEKKYYSYLEENYKIDSIISNYFDSEPPSYEEDIFESNIPEDEKDDAHYY